MCIANLSIKWDKLFSSMSLVFLRYVVLVSGLNIGSSWYDQLSIQSFVDYVTGQLGGPQVS